MTSKCRSLEVRGRTVPRGTALFDDQNGRVMWYDGVENGFVKLETIDGSIEISESVFRVHLIVGDFVIESRPTDGDT